MFIVGKDTHVAGREYIGILCALHSLLLQTPNCSKNRFLSHHMEAHTSNPNTWENGAGRSGFQDQPDT